ncbi:MAG: hypothetical protein ABF633_03420 [Clostridium sp.]|uniref:hypothetical protein n=1 Tax=Clostridium sp. TaxID=1506 RepID=UPI0039E99C36
MLGFFKKVKEVEVTLFDKAKLAVLGVESAMSVFANLISELNHANNSLKEVVDECEQVIQEHKDTQDKAKASIQEYETLLQNIEKLMGGTK